MAVKLLTSHGTLVINLYHKETPRTSRNFIELSKHGYYDGVIFHRIISDFVAQTGDPYGDGRGGESIWGQYFEDEIVAKLSHDRVGIVSMANAGRNTNSSQFFITFKAVPHLDGKHTVFGYVSEESKQVLMDISHAKVDAKKKPTTPVKIFSAQVTDDPWKDKVLPTGASIPEKPLVGDESKSNKCTIQ